MRSCQLLILIEGYIKPSCRSSLYSIFFKLIKMSGIRLVDYPLSPEPADENADATIDDAAGMSTYGNLIH